MESGKSHHFLSDYHMIWIFPCSSSKSQIGILGMNQDMEILRSSHVLGEVPSDRDGIRLLNERIWSHCRVIASLRGNDQSGRAPGVRSWSGSLPITLRRDTRFFKEVTESASCKNTLIWQFTWSQMRYGDGDPTKNEAVSTNLRKSLF